MRTHREGKSDWRGCDARRIIRPLWSTKGAIRSRAGVGAGALITWQFGRFGISSFRQATTAPTTLFAPPPITRRRALGSAVERDMPTTARGVAELHEKLETIVGKTSKAELSVLQPDGVYQLLFVGQLAALDVGWVATIASQPLTFYTFRVLELADDGELLRRFEISWLSDPPPPTVVDSTPSSATVTWLTAQVCGMDMTAFAGGHDGLLYQLEVAEGRAWKASRVARFPGLRSHPQHFKVMLQLRGGAQGAQGSLSEVKVTDLRPATWYHFRLRVTYAHGGEEVSTRAVACRATRLVIRRV